MTARVYGDFDQAQLDAQYSPSSLVGDIQPFLDDYAQSSRLARHELAPVARRDLRFGPSPDDLLDVYGPSGPGKDSRPALFFVHGGYWQQLSKEDSAFPAPALVEAGAVYATPDYTLAPRARLSDIVDQVRRAFAWLWHRAADHRIDPGRIVVAGSSAGAHLAAMLLATRWRQWGLPAAPIAGALLFGGIYDLAPVRQTYVNDVVRIDAGEVRDCSPLFLTGVRCPVVIAWGERETDEFKRQSSVYAAHLRRQGCHVTAFEQPGRNHFDSPMDLGTPSTRAHAETRRLLGLPSA
ncbi:arylformamidase [Streptomyces achromogenes]|uniref:alpha/beta hydrolase n=1 Tax=Streptomyces achromogenes TaxID=67255 RepID=UPI002789EEF9|nr:alpha/beta hydrolase [Streptomyces achromogenes]MDQ0829183.1 arylformamidase [Streptomyces achromogenes]